MIFYMHKILRLLINLSFQNIKEMLELHTVFISLTDSTNPDFLRLRFFRNVEFPYCCYNAVMGIVDSMTDLFFLYHRCIHAVDFNVEINGIFKVLILRVMDNLCHIIS